jgi:hypothetical protein
MLSSAETTFLNMVDSRCNEIEAELSEGITIREALKRGYIQGALDAVGLKNSVKEFAKNE